LIDGSPFILESIRRHKGNELLTIKGIDNIEKGQEYINKEIYIKNKPQELDNLYMAEELLEKEAVDQNNKYLGKVKNIIKTGADDVLSIIDDEKEFLVPAVEKFITKVDEERIIIDCRDL